MSDSRDFSRAIALRTGPARTAALACWVQSLYPAGRRKPVLVGGAAVELYTGGAYTTGDLDFVGSAPPEVARALEGAGFRRARRHWVQEAAQVFLEFPGSELEPASEPVELTFSGRRVVVVPIEGLLVDRLAAWKFWRSGVDAVNALLLLRAGAYPVDLPTARRLGRLEEVDDELERPIQWAQRLGTRTPSADEIETWLAEGRRTEREP